MRDNLNNSVSTMATQLNDDKTTYEKEKERFIKELFHFHETRGTPSRKVPKISGYEVDLYLLYTIVTGKGGWVKVNSRNEWDQVLDEFNIPKHCVNSDVAIKQIYLRYLDRYEKIHFHGELGVDDDEISRHRQWSARALHSIPMTYNHTQHSVNESLRATNGLSVSLYQPSEYDKLSLSLISPLPNEQDFAINVCTLLSNEGKHCLKLKKHPRILHYLLAHAAVFHNPSLRALFHEIYGKYRGHSMSHLWRDIINDESILKLTDESLYIEWEDSVEDGSDAVSNKTGLTFEPEDKELFCLGRTLGVQDYIGQRVCQIAAILRNLTFVNENMVLMGKDTTFLRFIILCCYSRWDSLHQMGWDMLCNIATEITERAPIMEHVLTLTNQGLLSEDRADILSALEVLTKLAQNELNEELLVKHLVREIYERICSFLTLHDIMLLVCTLECLNAITALGEKACNSVLAVHGIIDVLVSLVSVEAQSYGPKACIQMRVVETVRDYNSVCPPSQTQPQTSTNISSAPSTPIAASQSVPTQPSYTTPLSSQSSSPAVSSGISHQTPPRSQQVVLNTQRIITTPASTISAQATEQIAQENEKFALAWLRCTFEPNATGKVEQAELYKQYINYCAKIGRRGVIAPLHFPRIVRTVFGGSVGPKVVTTGELTQHFYEGIQMRIKPLTSVSAGLIHSTPSSILKAQLSAPPKPTPATPVKMQIVGEGTSQGPTSFMKTLLANKIAEHQKQQQLQQQQQQQLLQHEQQSEKLTESQPSGSISFDDSSQSSTTQEGITFKLNGIRSLMEILGKPDNTSGNVRTTTVFSSPINTISSNSVLPEEASTSNSSSIRCDVSETGTEENSKSSIDGFLSSIGQNCLSSDNTLKDVKVELKTESSVLNGSSCDAIIEIKDENIISNGIPGKEEKRETSKRPLEKEDDVVAKKPHLNGDEVEETSEQVNVSSSAANLYAALAADVLEDEPLEETTPGPVQVATTQPTQILVTAGGQLTQGVVVGGQYVVPQAKTIGQDQKQTVLVAQTTQQQGTSAKTIIILQPQGPSVSNSSQQVIRLQFPSPPSVLPTQQPSNIIRAIVPPKSTSNIPDNISRVCTSISQPTVSLPTVPAPCATFVSVSSSASNFAPSVSSTSQPVKQDTKPAVEQRHFLCEWRGCMRNFNTENEVYIHACEAHLPQGSEEIQCLWERCDAMKRKRFSLMTHLYDKHCNPDEMKMVAARRKQLSVTGKSELPTPSPAMPHPGYGPNAAYHAIKRHALDIVNIKDPQQRVVKPGPAPIPVPTEQASNEGPVTKSIRLTASLILRNLVVYSTNGRRHLMRYESFLACIALSNVESSRTIAHVLFDLCNSR